MRDWSDSEDETDAASGKVGTVSDDFDDREPPKEEYRPLRIPTSNQGDGLQSTFVDSGEKSGHLSIAEAVPQPTMMGIGRGVGRGKLASPPGNIFKFVEPLTVHGACNKYTNLIVLFYCKPLPTKITTFVDIINNLKQK